jgi:hypothetical protein
VGAVATPLLFVTAVAVVDPLNPALAPVPGAVNVTVTPLTGLLLRFFTVTCNAVGNEVLIATVCGVPALAVSVTGVFRTTLTDFDSKASAWLVAVTTTVC